MIDDMVSLGYTKEQVIKMTERVPTIFCHDISYIIQKVSDLESLGYTREQIIKMTLICPSIYTQSTENIEKKLKTLGYTVFVTKTLV